MNELKKLSGGTTPGGGGDVPADDAAPDTPLGQPHQAAPAQRFTVRDLLVRVFYRARLLRNCVILGLLLGGLGAWKARTYFTADTLFLIFIGPESAAAQDVSGTGTTLVSVDGLKVVQSETQIIQTDQVISAAIQKVGVNRLYPAIAKPRLFGLLPALSEDARMGAAVQNFRGDLKVEAETGSNIIRVSFTHDDRKVAIEAVQAVIAGYLTQRRAIYSNGATSFLDQEIARYNRNLHTLESEIQAVRAKYDVLDMAQDIVLATNRLDGIVQRENQVRERRVAVQTEIIAVKANLTAQPPTVLDFREATNNTGNDEARNTLVRLEQERTHLTAQYGPDWPAIREVEAKIRTVQGQINSKTGALYFSERTIRNPAVDVLNNRLASLQVEDKALEQQLGELEDQSKSADLRIKSLREADGQLHSLQITRDVAEGIYRQLSIRQPGSLFQDNVVEERNANMRVVQAATAPLVGKSLGASYLFGGGFVGLLLGIAASVVGTLLQQTYLMPSEAERELGLSCLGEFRLDAPKDGVPDNPNGIASLAAMLQEVRVGGRPLALLQIVAVADEDGKATVLHSLAMELAQGFERRTLILDMQGNGRGQARALGRGDAVVPPDPACPVLVTPTDVHELWVSLDAPQALWGEKRGAIARANAALQTLADQFSIVLVFASPDMSDHLVRRLCGLVDANLLVLRAERTRGAVAGRLCDTVLATGGNLLGFVFVGRKYYVPRWLYRWV